MARKARPKAKKSSAGKSSRKPAAAKGKVAKGAKVKATKAAVPAAPATRDALDEMIDAAAKALSLKCNPAWMPSIKVNLQVILRQAALVDAFALPDEVEPAPVFEA